MRIHGQDMLLPTTMVGNYPNPRWYDGHGFATLPRGEFIHDSISKEAFEDTVGAIVHDQEAAGFDVISDGKVYGGDSPYGTILYYYLERVSGYRLSGPPIGLPIYSTLYSPTCVGEVRREVPFHLVNLRAVRKATKKPVKVSYTGLGVIAAATTNLHYKDTREVAMALAKAFNEDFKELADNGCDIIQLDEFVWPYGMGDWEIDALNASVEGVNCDFWVHTCWGNYSGTPAYFPDETETEFGAFVLDKRASDAPAPERAHAIFPHVLNANITALNYEVGRTGPDDLKPLTENNWTKPFVAGVIDVKSTMTESADEVADRIRQVLEYVPADRLGLSTDCGLINLPRMIAAPGLTRHYPAPAPPLTPGTAPSRGSTECRNLVLAGQRNSAARVPMVRSHHRAGGAPWPSVPPSSACRAGRPSPGRTASPTCWTAGSPRRAPRPSWARPRPWWTSSRWAGASGTSIPPWKSACGSARTTTARSRWAARCWRWRRARTGSASCGTGRSRSA